MIKLWVNRLTAQRLPAQNINLKELAASAAFPIELQYGCLIINRKVISVTMRALDYVFFDAQLLPSSVTNALVNVKYNCALQRHTNTHANSSSTRNHGLLNRQQHSPMRAHTAMKHARLVMVLIISRWSLLGMDYLPRMHHLWLR